MNDPDSVYRYYQRLIRLRREYAVITDGEYRLLDADNPFVYTYTRTAGGQTLLVLCNFTASVQSAAHIEPLLGFSEPELLLGNYAPVAHAADALRHYEARVYLLC